MFTFIRSDMESPKSPRISRPTILERGVKEATGSRYPFKIKRVWIMPISLPHLMDKVGIWECFYGIIPTYVLPSSPFFPPNVLQPGRDGALEKSIVVYENTHGTTKRITGGGTGRCLQTTEAGSELNRKILPCLIMYFVNMCVSLFFFWGGDGNFYVGQVLNQTGGIRSYP